MRIAYNLLEGTDPAQIDIIRCLCETYPKDLNLILKSSAKRSGKIEALPFSPMFFKAPEAPFLSWLRQETGLPFTVSENRIDILYCPSFSAPLRQPSRTVAAAGNIDHLLFSDEKVRGLENRIRSFFAAAAAKKANRLVVYSEFYRKVVHKALGVPESRIDVMPYPAAAEFRPVFDAVRMQAVQKKYGIQTPYFIYSGGHAERNNIKELIEIFIGFLTHKNNVSLVLAGGGMKSLESLRDNNVLKNRVFLIDDVSGEELALLYNGSCAYVTTSAFEAFPYDAQKAMACGVPVICYDNSSFSEILGNACIPVAGGDKSAFVKAMRQVKDNGDLKLKLRALGIQRAKQFNAGRAALLLRKTFEKTFKEDHPPDEK